MKNPTIQEIVIQFVEDIPGEYVSRITDMLQKETKFESGRMMHRIQNMIPQADVQELIRLFVENWGKLKDVPSPKEMALMLSAVDSALEHHRQKQSIELTWTGPKTREVNLRRTDQALIELINLSNKRVIIVSFAVYKAKTIMSALEKAANRGVEINIIIESPDASEGKIAYDTIAALGRAMKSKARIFIWPHAKRQVTPNGKYGALHAKVAVGDQNILYISSANLTDYAMSLNMEMGILVFGGELPAQAQGHFDELITEGTLSELSFE
jgi:phosphatidylserine/phosphatidylglycerophosphate/cardiolipin synthase-like enzyme